MKDKKIKESSQVDYLDSIPTRVALLEMSIVTINATLIRLEGKMDKGFYDLRKDMKSDFRWLLTIIAGLGAIMAHGFHWF